MTPIPDPHPKAKVEPTIRARIRGAIRHALAIAVLSAIVLVSVPASALTTLGSMNLAGQASGIAVVGELDVPGSVIEVVDGIAYVLGAQQNRSLRVIDVTNSTLPMEIGAVELVDPSLGHFGFSDLEIVEGLAYVTFGRVLAMDRCSLV